MIKLTKENTRRAVERARELRPKVAYLIDRQWIVYSARNRNEYIVRLSKAGRDIFAACTCRAGREGNVCYHAVCAAGAQIGIARMRRAAK